MVCLRPIPIVNPNLVPDDPNSPSRIMVPCGKCVFCKHRRRQEWAYRLQMEAKFSDSSYFVTLTYDDYHLPLRSDGTAVVSKRDCQTFIKRLRKKVDGLCDRPMRYYLCSEYGPTTLRPHYHMLLFNFPVDHLPIDRVVQDAWGLGTSPLGPLRDGGQAYCCKYVLQPFDYDIGDRPKPFALMSRRPGIGFEFITPELINYCHAQQTIDIPVGRNLTKHLPRYIREKIFSKEDLSQLTELVRLKMAETFHDHLRQAKYHGRNAPLFLQKVERLESSFIEKLKKHHVISKL